MLLRGAAVYVPSCCCAAVAVVVVGVVAVNVVLGAWRWRFLSFVVVGVVDVVRARVLVLGFVAVVCVVVGWRPLPHDIGLGVWLLWLLLSSRV